MQHPLWEKGEIIYGLHRSIQRTYHVYSIALKLSIPKQAHKDEMAWEYLYRHK